MTIDALPYPAAAFSFTLAFADGTGGGNAVPIAHFSAASGLDAMADRGQPGDLGKLGDATGGGENRLVHRLPGGIRHNTVVLKRGLCAKASPLAQWAEQSIGSALATGIETRTLVLQLVDASGAPAMRWTLANAWPVNWLGAGFDDTAADLAIESIEIAFATMTAQRLV